VSVGFLSRHVCGGLDSRGGMKQGGDGHKIDASNEIEFLRCIESVKLRLTHEQWIEATPIRPGVVLRVGLCPD